MRVLVVEVLRQHRSAYDRLDRREVYAHHHGRAALGVHALDRNLRPAARRRAEIDHPPAVLEEVELVVELQQLEGGT
jgi:hypothetical protein